MFQENINQPYSKLKSALKTSSIRNSIYHPPKQPTNQ
jgi:hypothetical protein